MYIYIYTHTHTYISQCLIASFLFLMSHFFKCSSSRKHVGLLGSPAIIGPKDGFCSGKFTPSERCQSRARAIPSVFGPLNQPKGGVTKNLYLGKWIHYPS